MKVTHSVKTFHELIDSPLQPVCMGHRHILANPILISLAMNDTTVIRAKRSGLSIKAQNIASILKDSDFRDKKWTRIEELPRAGKETNKFTTQARHRLNVECCICVHGC